MVGSGAVGQRVKGGLSLEHAGPAFKTEDLTLHLAENTTHFFFKKGNNNK